MLQSGGQQIDPCGLDAAMPQYGCQLYHIPADPVESASEQMPQIVREDLFRWYACSVAELFHFCPNLSAGQTSAAPSEKNLTGGNFFLPGVF